MSSYSREIVLNVLILLKVKNKCKKKVAFRLCLPISEFNPKSLTFSYIPISGLFCISFRCTTPSPLYWGTCLGKTQAYGSASISLVM